MRILIFGPNGSGKGTQSAFLAKQFQLAHVESGGIFRKNIKGGTALGEEALKYINKGELVPDSITIPMVLDRLAEADCQAGFILDGFPRTEDQATALLKGLATALTPLSVVVVINLPREVASSRLMGRHICPNGHSNNLAIAQIAPIQNGDSFNCWSCGAGTTVRGDDVDVEAINLRLDIYFKETMAALTVVENWAKAESVKVVHVDGVGDISDIRNILLSQVAP